MKVNQSNNEMQNIALKTSGTQKNKVDKANKKSTSINGNSLKITNDPMSVKRAQAKKQALKIIGDAYDADKKIDDDLETRRDKIRQYKEVIGENRKAIKDLEDQRKALRDEYGVDPDSQEEKDLELLAKEKESHFAGSKTILSYEEQLRVKEIKEKGLTEYQERSLELKGYEEPYAADEYEARQGVVTENAIIVKTKLERLKDDPMVDANKEADNIMDEANKDIAQIAMAEAKDYVEEKQEEEKEKAKEQKEKAEELQEKIDEAKARRKEEEKFTEDIIENAQEISGPGSKIQEAQQEVKDMMNRMKLVEEDVKGTKVDEKL